MTSEIAGQYTEAYVWVWLPEAITPVVAGLLSKQGEQLIFNYGRSYLNRREAIPLYAPELPLQSGIIPLLPSLRMPSCIRDASPDAWGRRVLINRKLGGTSKNSADIELDEMTYLLESGSDRIGALDFQRSPTQYTPRQTQQPSLENLQTAADQVERGMPLSSELDLALLHGTSLGGARPKAMIDDGQHKFIAKFSSSSDLYSVVKVEFIAMRLAHKVGLNVAPVYLRSTMGKDVILIERFDRIQHDDHWHRKIMVSALTLFGLDEMMASYASYETLAEIIRHRFVDAKATLRELFSRIVFNILCGNTDDHARNHAAFWNGYDLSLTPAYDICPQVRSGQEASQAMYIHGINPSSKLATCISAAANFLLDQQEAIRIVNYQVDVIQREWQATCDDAHLSVIDRAYFWRRQFLNPFAFFDAPDGVQIPLNE